MSESVVVSPVIPAAGSVVMYTTSWCGYCRRLKTQMESAGIDFSEVNIETTPGTAEYVEWVNGGHQTVPTVVFADGSALTNPSLVQLKDRLALV